MFLSCNRFLYKFILRFFNLLLISFELIFSLLLHLEQVTLEELLLLLLYNNNVNNNNINKRPPSKGAPWTVSLPSDIFSISRYGFWEASEVRRPRLRARPGPGPPKSHPRQLTRRPQERPWSPTGTKPEEKGHDQTRAAAGRDNKLTKGLPEPQSPEPLSTYPT